MDLTTHIDTTIPAWSVVCAVAVGVWHVIQLSNRVSKLEATLSELKEIIKEYNAYVYNKGNQKTS